jgi:transcriptional regulator with XRE-family HTH domain
MKGTDASADFRKDFVRRVKLAREGSRFTQDEIAKLLGMDQGTYKQYETRSLLPHRYVTMFCALTRVSEKWLLSGKGKMTASLDR